MQYIGKIEYGEEEIEEFFPKYIEEEDRLIELGKPKGHPEIKDIDKALHQAIFKPEDPRKIEPLSRIVKKRYKGGNISIIVDDYTRPNVHTKILLPKLLRELYDLGIKKEKIRIIIATGTHRAPTEAEFPKILGEDIWPEYKENVVVHSHKERLVKIGNMEDGTPIELDEVAYNSEIIIPLTDLDYHYFAGVAGGPKQILPGIAGGEIIRVEHLKMFGKIGFAENVDSGIMDNNPVFEYKREAIKIMSEELRKKGTYIYAITTVLNPENKLVHIAGGDLLDTHKNAKKILDKVYISEIDKRADVVIISARHEGINMYQAGKAFNSAKRAVKRGGKILVLAPCPESFGNIEFKNLMKLSAAVFDETRKQLQYSMNKEEDATRGIDKAIEETQKVVVADFKIGKQKPVDLLAVYEHTGWDNLYIIDDGITDEDRALLPFNYVGKRGEPAQKRLREWIENLELSGKPTYCIVEDPGLLIQVKGEG